MATTKKSTTKKSMTNKQAAAKRKSLKAKGQSGIVIKPQNKGKFTAYKKRTGQTTAQAKKSKNPAVRRMATFAANAAKWSHKGK